MKTVALYGGQGSQYPGMGKSLYDAFACVRQIYECAGDILGFDVAGASFEGDEARLAATAVSQPVIFTHSLAAFEAAKDQLPAPDAVAGHSLGEYAALCCGGAFSREDGFRIIAARARVMEEAARSVPGAMVAISGSTEDAVKAVCEEYEGVWAVNFNLPSQTVISGLEEPCLAAAARLESEGARVTRLKVGTAFHSPLMEQAAEELKKLTADFSYSATSCAFYSNLTGGLYAIEDYPDYFARHMVSPVLFTSQIPAMVTDGIDTCVEFGPKKTAATLAKKNHRGFTVLNVEDAESLAKASAYDWQK